MGAAKICRMAQSVGIFSHCAIDTISVDGSEFEQVGGAACYGGLTARRFKMNVRVATKFGADFPADEYLEKNKISFEAAASTKLTTRFAINVRGSERDLILASLCEPIPYQDLDTDGIIVSPIFNEIAPDTFDRIKKDTGMILLDPQGFVRRQDDAGKISLARADVCLDGIDILKAGRDEMESIAGGSDVQTLKALRDGGVKHILLTDKANISMLTGDRLYSLRLPNKEIHDTTGIGDIFCATFLCTLLKENDVMWAFCFAAGSAQAALDTHAVGLAKIPGRGQTEINASYFYNTFDFRQV